MLWWWQGYRYSRLEKETSPPGTEGSWGEVKVLLRAIAFIFALLITFSIGKHWPQPNVGDPIGCESYSREKV